MQWAMKFSGANGCGFAGQLGPILERRHGFAMKAPFFNGIPGTIFGIDNTISFLARQAEKKPFELSVAVLGGGEIGAILLKHFTTRGYGIHLVNMTFKRHGGVVLSNPDEAKQQLKAADYVINLLPSGDIFLQSGVPELLASQTTVIDFGRPGIPKDQVKVKVVQGNRVQRTRMKFLGALPAGWQRDRFPACSISSILATNFGVMEQNVTRFCDAASNFAFHTALSSPPTQPLHARCSQGLKNIYANIILEDLYSLQDSTTS